MNCCKIHYNQRRNEATWRPGPRSKFGAPCSNLMSFGSQFGVLKKVRVTLLGLFRPPGNCAHFDPSLRSWPHLDVGN